MMMKAAPVAALEVAKAELLLEFLIVPLDPPARLGDPHETFERGAPREVGEPVLGWRGGNRGKSPGTQVQHTLEIGMRGMEFRHFWAFDCGTVWTITKSARGFAPVTRG